MMSKPKRLTQKEKRLREQARKELIAKGILPPRKKPLNRKKFVAEALEAYNAGTGIERELLGTAIGWVINTHRPTLEDVGVAKVLKVACAIVEFEKSLEESHRPSYKMSELHKFLMPILYA